MLLAQSESAHTAFRASAKWMSMQLALVFFSLPRSSSSLNKQHNWENRSTAPSVTRAAKNNNSDPNEIICAPPKPVHQPVPLMRAKFATSAECEKTWKRSTCWVIKPTGSYSARLFQRNALKACYCFCCVNNNQMQSHYFDTRQSSNAAKTLCLLCHKMAELSKGEFWSTTCFCEI